MKDANWLTKKMAVLGIVYGAFISIGAAYLSAGIAMSYTIHPLIDLYMQNNSTQYAQYEHGIVNDLIKSSALYINGGISLIALSVFSAIFIIYWSKIKKLGRQTNLTSFTDEKKNTEQRNSNYDDSKYIKTRKQLAYHPEDKRNRN